MDRGLFITFEGPDGSGKSTQAKLLKAYYEDQGFDVIMTREPGGTDIGERVRKIILDKSSEGMSLVAEVMLFAASRAQLVDEVIRPSVNAGKVVLCDRFVDSSIAYQGYGLELGSDMVAEVNAYAIGDMMPDVTIFMDIKAAHGLDRIEKADADRIESLPQTFHERVYEGYLELSKKYADRYLRVDATKSIEEIHHDVISKLSQK
jgi:dTMP kinase